MMRKITGELQTIAFLFSYEIISTITTVRNSSAIYDEQPDSKDTLGGDLIFLIEEGLTSGNCFKILCNVLNLCMQCV
jgi:hypothetical protein